jgi:hypothetical protein
VREISNRNKHCLALVPARPWLLSVVQNCCFLPVWTRATDEATLPEREISIQKYILVLPTIGSTACAAIGVFANLKNKYQRSLAEVKQKRTMELQLGWSSNW